MLVLYEWSNFDQYARRRTFVGVLLFCFLQTIDVICKQFNRCKYPMSALKVLNFLALNLIEIFLLEFSLGRGVRQWNRVPACTQRRCYSHSLSMSTKSCKKKKDKK